MDTTDDSNSPQSLLPSLTEPGGSKQIPLFFSVPSRREPFILLSANTAACRSCRSIRMLAADAGDNEPADGLARNCDAVLPHWGAVLAGNAPPVPVCFGAGGNAAPVQRACLLALLLSGPAPLLEEVRVALFPLRQIVVSGLAGRLVLQYDVGRHAFLAGIVLCKHKLQ